MAVGTPVFERSTNTYKEDERRKERMSVETNHNSRISDNFARLVNPENKIKDIIASIDAEGSQIVPPVVEDIQPVMQHPKTVVNQAPVYFVRNARADADIFRADSPVNASAEYMPPRPIYTNITEGEDLRPTSVNMQYQTVGVDGSVKPFNSTGVKDKSKISHSAEQPEKENRFVLKRRDKVILGVIVALIVAVFTLIIINSAVIYNLKSDISELETLRQAAVAEYEQVVAEYEDVISEDSVRAAAQAAGIFMITD